MSIFLKCSKILRKFAGSKWQLALSEEAYRKLRGLPSGMPSAEVSKLLRDMMLQSIGPYTDNLVVEVLGTVETQELQVQVSIKDLGETSQMPLRSALRLRPVRTLKHIVDIPTSTVLAVQSTAPVIEAVNDPTIGNTTQVHQGSTVNAIYLRVEVISTTTFSQVPRIYMAVFKNPGNNFSVPNSNAAGSADTKRYIIHQEMIMVDGVPDISEFPRTLFNGVIRIPPRLKRFGYNDKLVVLLQNGAGETTGIVNACVQCIYKEFV